MTHRKTTFLLGAFLGLIANVAAAGELRPAIFGSAGIANLQRTEDRSFGTELNVGAGLGFEWKRLGFDADLHRTLGLTPHAVQCAVDGVACVGSAREGFAEATILAGKVSYFFGTSRVRPYVTGSAGVLWTESINSLTIASTTPATLSEFVQRDTGLAVGVGVGLDVPLTRTLSLRPEFHSHSSVAVSRVNLGLHRGAIYVRRSW